MSTACAALRNAVVAGGRGQAASTRCIQSGVWNARLSAAFASLSRPTYMYTPAVLCGESRRSVAGPFVCCSTFTRSVFRVHSTLHAAPTEDQERGGGGGFFANPDDHPDFASIGVQSSVLTERVEKMLLSSLSSASQEQRSDQQHVRPSAVQAAAYQSIASGADVTIGAETGSGKTLAYLLPLIDDILKSKQESTDGYLGYDYARAVILVPNKELAAQVVRMASELCGGRDRCVLWEGGSAPQTPFGAPLNDDGGGDDDDESQIDGKEIVRLAVMPGGLKDPKDFRPFRAALTDPLNNPPVDLVITTPASLGPMALSPKNIDLFADIRTVVIDEADMLLDGGYLRQLNNVLMGFRRADKLDSELTGVEKTQHVLVAATLPDVGLKSVDAYIAKKFPYAERVTMDGLHNARHYGLRDSTIWIEDDEDGSNKARMEKLVQMLQTPSDGGGEGGLGGEKVMVFLNSVDDVDGATGALRRAGLDAVPYHAKMSLSERADNLDRFRRYEATKTNDDEGGDTAPVLVCTDLASRGLDVPGVTAVVQLQFAGNVVAHLHRMGRCGRAGKKNGRGVVFYGEMEHELVEVVRKAEHQQETMTLEQDVLDEELDENGNKKPRRGSVQGAFSRKRGFTKKRKKERRVAGETSGGNS
eukprot:CAMPEP_0178497002 /NCGR_PEP_ID=MMETSP0696-20121128/14434_1 /TAXON_ID=265572 /ORGANISM="Extubocellulus spinifer, Strain CCMP396" /LENGTH=644 /DNA_ID=CAMNT_0020125355 /DNA_START=132 /DNA_END=2066 /DNA_ORIENTATION=-